jgi:dihydroorotate dehydrogenase electron transfer subunit
MPVDLALRVAAQEDLGAAHFLLTLDTEGAVPAWLPGQFAMLATSPRPDQNDPLLRRPFSIFNVSGDPPGALQVFYKVTGRGTAMLSDARRGDRLRCLAPLGNGFAPARQPSDRLLLVAGGIGSASLHPLALSEQAAARAPLMLYGCRSAAELAGIEPTRQRGIETRVSTDDGSAGTRGLVTALLEEALAPRGAAESWIVCVCGPTPMMRAAARVCAQRGARCHVSLESMMACGFGVCVGCVVGTRAGAEAPLRYERICIEGPVFDAAGIAW